MDRPDFRFLSAEHVRQALDMRQAITLMKDAFARLSEGQAAVPLRVPLEIPEHHGRALFMPVYLPSNGRIGVKVVAEHRDNPARGLPLIHALVMVMDAATGQPVAVMDGESLTALRTGAGSGLATDLLARRDARVAAVFGAGVQARTQLEAVCAVRDIRLAYVFNRSSDRAAACAREMSERLALDVRVAENAGQLREADVICTATSSPDPVFSHRHVRPGAHINGIGSYRPDMAEVPPETVRAAKVVVDHRPACLAEAGDLIQPLRQGVIDERHLYAELGEIVTGKKEGRTSDEEVTFFKSVGNAVQDLAAAGHVAAVAQRLRLGIAVR